MKAISQNWFLSAPAENQRRDRGKMRDKSKAIELYNTGLKEVKEGRLDEAIQALSEAIQIDPVHVNSHNLLGKTLIRKGKILPARRCWRSALKIDPLNVTAIDCLKTLNKSLLSHLLSSLKTFLPWLITILAVILAIWALLT